MAASHPSIPGVTFKDIDGFPGYCLGDDGSVWSCWKRAIGANGYVLSDEWRRRSPNTYKAGYACVSLRRDGKSHNCLIHRLLLEAFVGSCPAGMECRHLNGNPKDNRLENLAWGTHQQNLLDRIQHGTYPRGEKHGCTKLKDEDIPVIRSLLLQGVSGVEIARRFSVTKYVIWSIKCGKNWSHVT